MIQKRFNPVTGNMEDYDPSAGSSSGYFGPPDTGNDIFNYVQQAAASGAPNDFYRELLNAGPGMAPTVASSSPSGYAQQQTAILSNANALPAHDQPMPQGYFGLSMNQPQAPQQPAVDPMEVTRQNQAANASAHGPLQATVADAPINDFSVDQSSGWMAPLNTNMPNQAFPNLGTALAYGQDYGNTQPAGAMQTQQQTAQIDPSLNTDGSGGGIDYSQLLGDIPQIGQIDLPNNPQIDPLYSQDFNKNWQNMVSGQANNLAQYYSPSQIDTSSIPQPGAQQVNSNPALDFLMSGQGYDPHTLSLMRGQATDSATRSAAGERGSARMLAQRAGLENSGAGLAVENQINRRLGDSVNNAQNQISINNAQTGMENLRQAAPMELQRGTTNAGMANQMALDNAARLFSGMQQNVANSQATGLARGNAQSGLVSNAASQYGAGSLDRANQADFTNNSNSINRNLNQANLNRGRDIFNTQVGENRYGNALNILNSNATGANTSANQLQTSGSNLSTATNPNLIPANTYSNLGTTLINAANQKKTS